MKVFIVLVEKGLGRKWSNLNSVFMYVMTLTFKLLSKHRYRILDSLNWTKFIEMFSKIVMIYFDKPKTCIWCRRLTELTRQCHLTPLALSQFLASFVDLSQQPWKEEIHFTYLRLPGLTVYLRRCLQVTTLPS